VPFGFVELAAAVSDIMGRDIPYRNVSLDEYRQGLIVAGLDEGTAGFLAALEANTAAGDLDTESDDLARLLGRPATSPALLRRPGHTVREPAAAVHPAA
jgi:NAD(P)H dehydrogenase (quinone)